MTTAVYPGTFDPFHAGHRDVADRARHLFTPSRPQSSAKPVSPRIPAFATVVLSYHL
jgi:nicotinic acid mononucleotide adenylyltransferase